MTELSWTPSHNGPQFESDGTVKGCQRFCSFLKTITAICVWPRTQKSFRSRDCAYMHTRLAVRPSSSSPDSTPDTVLLTVHAGPACRVHSRGRDIHSSLVLLHRAWCWTSERPETSPARDLEMDASCFCPNLVCKANSEAAPFFVHDCTCT